MELLLTALGLLAAIYAVIPRERQLDLRLRTTLFDGVVVAFVFLFVLYLEFNEFFSNKGWVLQRPWPTGVSAQNTIYLVILGGALILFFSLSSTKLTRRTIGKFREQIEELYWGQGFGELFAILQLNAPELFKIAKTDPYRVRIHRYLKRVAEHSWLESLTGNQLQALIVEFGSPKAQVAAKTATWSRFRGYVDDAKRWIASRLLKFFQDEDRSQEVAKELISALITSPKFVSAMVTTRPYLGLDLIRHAEGLQDRFELVELYLTECIKDPTSVFYQEIANNQNRSALYRYAIPNSNRLLSFFLRDTEFTKDVAAYRPIGEYALDYLDELSRDHEADPYNRAMGTFKERGASMSPLWATIHFFDIMVEEALYQGTPWHMWLYYMPDIVKRMLRNYRVTDPLSDPDSEWLNRYAYLLYEIFSAMRDWIQSIEDVPADQANVKLKNTSAHPENDNIPKSAILAMAQCARRVIEADANHVSQKFKNYLLDMEFRLYFDLRNEPETEDYAQVLKDAIVQGGTYKPRHDNDYEAGLRAAFEANQDEYSIKYYEHVDELKDAIV